MDRSSRRCEDHLESHMGEKQFVMKGAFALRISAAVCLLVVIAMFGCGGTSEAPQRAAQLFVSNLSDDSISAFGATLDGDTQPLRRLGGISLTGLRGVAIDTVNGEYYAVNGSSVAVYDRAANGAAAPVRTISGFSTGLRSACGVAVDEVHNEIFLADLDTFSVSVFARTAKGDVSPLRKISGSVSLYDRPTGVAVDPVHDEIFVANNIQIGFNSVKVYSRTASGSASPIRIISGDATGLVSPLGVSVDLIHNEIFVLNTDLAGDMSTILVFGRTADGNVAPLRTISWASTISSQPSGMAVDPQNNEILLTQSDGSVTVYSRTADGNAEPLRIISGSSTDLMTPADIAVDPKNNEIIVANPDPSVDFHNSIVIYERKANGDVAPVRKILEFSTGLYEPTRIAVDPVHKELFAPGGVLSAVNVYPIDAVGDTAPIRTISGFSPGTVGAIAVDSKNEEVLLLHATSRYGTTEIAAYSRTASGDAVPLRTLQSASLFLANAVTVDPTDDEIFVASLSSSATPFTPATESAIAVYPRTAEGNTTPLRIISGGLTGLDQPSAMALDISGGELFVSNAGNNSITVYSRTASGDIAPIRTISGDKTGLSQPSGIVLDMGHDLIFVSNFLNDSITAYPRTASGNAEPVKVFSGASTGLNGPSSLAFSEE